MAVRRMYAVHDSKAGAFLPPFFTLTRGMAMRSFMAAARDPNHEFHKFGEDFCLFELGEFEDVKGTFEIYGNPVSLGKAISFKEGE